MTMTTRRLSDAIVAATIALMCTAAQARASAIQLVDASHLSTDDTVATYPSPLPDPFGFQVVAGGVTLTFSTPGILSTNFMADELFAPQFPTGATLLANIQEGPLTITFLTGIKELGFFAQGFIPEQPQAFTFSVFQGNARLNTFTVGPMDNGVPGVALFIGAQATGGDLITGLTINNTGSADEFFDPSFVIGPITVGEAAAAVPEPGTLVLLGSGLLYGARRLRRRAV